MVTRDVLKSGVNLPLIGAVPIVGVAIGAVVLYFVLGRKRIASKTIKYNYRK